MLNRTIAPESREVQEINFIKPIKQQLDNGIPVFTINAGQQELVRIEFLFQNVNWDKNKPLQSLVVSHLINNGTADLSAKDIYHIARNSFHASFLDEKSKKEMIAKVDAYYHKHGRWVIRLFCKFVSINRNT